MLGVEVRLLNWGVARQILYCVMVVCLMARYHVCQFIMFAHFLSSSGKHLSEATRKFLSRRCQTELTINWARVTDFWTYHTLIFQNLFSNFEPCGWAYSASWGAVPCRARRRSAVFSGQGCKFINRHKNISYEHYIINHLSRVISNLE